MNDPCRSRVVWRSLRPVTVFRLPGALELAPRIDNGGAERKLGHYEGVREEGSACRVGMKMWFCIPHEG